MVNNKSLDEYEVIAALLCDIQMSHSEVFTPRALKLTAAKLQTRYAREGLGLFTKTFLRLAKALDRALTGEVPLNSTGFRKKTGSQLPIFMGELFQCIFSHDGWVLPTPCVRSIKDMRQLLYLYSKYKLPYETEQEQEVLDQFKSTDLELDTVNRVFDTIDEHGLAQELGVSDKTEAPSPAVIRKARLFLQRVFQSFDVRDIYPRHGPGSVSTKETGPSKYQWTSVSPRLTNSYPLDEYFFVSVGHVCDRLQELQAIEEKESSAKIILVPKDSRGPRLISEEPLTFQWIQQGLARAIVSHVESHALTRHAIHFTDQRPNQIAALMGSLDKVVIPYLNGTRKVQNLIHGKYATLDLKEASDRVSIGLVRLLFPKHISDVLMNCRSLSTVTPAGEVIQLNKFAPMGSALCFPILALSIWAILAASASDAYSRERILVYGDDVVVETAEAANAIKQLELFGLKVNRDKSCTKGFFRESCGVDAYKGVDVTPVRIRTVWAHTRRPEVYASYIAYANSLHSRLYRSTYDLIVGRLLAIYGDIPSQAMFPERNVPCLVEVPEQVRPTPRRCNRDLQRLQYKVWTIKSKRQTILIDGWSMLLRYFAESVGRPRSGPSNLFHADAGPLDSSWLPYGATDSKFSVSSYTKRDTEQLVKCWR